MGKFTHIASRDGGGRGGEETDVTLFCSLDRPHILYSLGWSDFELCFRILKLGTLRLIRYIFMSPIPENWRLLIFQVFIFKRSQRP